MENASLTVETRKIVRRQSICRHMLMILFAIVCVACVWLIAVFLWTDRSSTTPQCKAPMSYLNGRCYYIYLGKNNFFQIPCMYLRPTADRVSVESAAELQGLAPWINALGLPDGSGFWTSANRLDAQQLDFVWDYPYTSHRSNLSYSRWLPGEPSNKTTDGQQGEERNCLQLRLVRGELFMVTENCYAQAYQICERAYNLTLDGVLTI
ncbi:hypothetical protein KR222_010934 [Zaprionus bogoriensis]|nr:hypothetical protein KR222_010934 [Zaprionus bogoriensis]